MLHSKPGSRDDKSLSLIRKGKSNVPDERRIFMLQISENHICYIKEIDKFLKEGVHANLRGLFPIGLHVKLRW